MLNLKLTLSEHFTATLLKVAVPAFLLAIVAFVPVFVAADNASADSSIRVTLGKKNMRLEPNCGKSNFNRDCIVEGNVTGYQALSKKESGRNFEVPFKGKIIAWSISLARPTKKDVLIGPTNYPAQSPFFNGLFGSPSQARISVLRRIEKRKKGPPKYKLIRQSPTQILDSYFGTTPHFALTNPLNVNEGQVVALTIPTWAPAIWKPAVCNDSPYENEDCNTLEKKYTWRGSRGPKYCDLGFEDNGDPNAALRKSRPQQKIGSDKRYGCYYGGNVLLYSATIVGQ
jgi:hypothetical protein